MREPRVLRARLRYARFAAHAGLVLAALSPLVAEGFETAGEVPAASYLPAAELAGPGWRVAATATNDGAVNTYSVESRFGSFPAHGRSHVARRGKEVEALEELDRISKSDVFLDAVKASAVGQIQTVQAFATKPVETVKGLGSGAKRLFDRTTLRVKEGANDAGEWVEDKRQGGEEGSAEDADTRAKAEAVAREQALSYLKISAAERRWYAQLGVDPYTDNELLRAAIKSYARVEGLTKFGMRFVGLPSIPGIGELSKAMELVWETDPWDLRKRNRDALTAMGISVDTARAFEDNPWLSLTQQTLLVESLSQLGDVKGRANLIGRAIEVESHADGRNLLASVARLVQLHRELSPLVELLGGTRLPVARSADGVLHAALVADALFWTREIAGSAAGFAEVYRGQPAARRELNVEGRTSRRFVEESRALGWQVVEHH